LIHSRRRSTIPGWTSGGYLPPNSRKNPASLERSPYLVGIFDFVTHFNTSFQRRGILKGFLEYRTTLYAGGFSKGFQWINGSFLENIEQSKQRPPRDIDVVTFAYVPDELLQAEITNTIEDLFNTEIQKDKYLVDTYFVQLNCTTPERLVEMTSYWYSLWSYRRNGIWKGFVQVDLDPEMDGQVLSQLLRDIPEEKIDI
jgi:hypothetical protein